MYRAVYSRKIYVYSSFTRKLVTGTMRFHGSRPTFRRFHRSRDPFLPYSKQCPSINVHLRFAICARKGSAALGPHIVANTHTHRDARFSLVRYSHASVFPEWTLFFSFFFIFFTRGRCNVTRVRNYVRHRNLLPCSCLACRSSLVPPRLEQRGKLKLSTCPLTRGHFR